jgi:hypothetical protein
VAVSKDLRFRTGVVLTGFSSMNSILPWSGSTTCSTAALIRRPKLRTDLAANPPLGAARIEWTIPTFNSSVPSANVCGVRGELVDQEFRFRSGVVFHKLRPGQRIDGWLVVIWFLHRIAFSLCRSED